MSEHGHLWSGWPGAYCLRCGAGQVLEIALGEGWLSPGYDQMDDKWRSEDHKALVDLCDNHCYADMTEEERESHKFKINVLQEKLGV